MLGPAKRGRARANPRDPGSRRAAPQCVPEGAAAFGRHHLVMGGHFVIQFALQPPAIDPVMDAP